MAVPHGKTAAVKKAAFAVATLSEPLQWEGVDGPERFIYRGIAGDSPMKRDYTPATADSADPAPGG
ncbi:hypothetical protein ACNKHU_03470 [Shigella flexneri]